MIETALSDAGASPDATTAPSAGERRRAAVITAAVFLCGGVTLGLEMIAGRLLAPYFGNSLYVWGSVIGVVLTGLSIGYSVAGRLADRWPNAKILVAGITASAACVFMIPVLDEAILEFVVRWDPGPRLNPLVASALLFGLPAVVLAAVTPIAVRLRATTLASLGRTAGTLFSVSTAGSIVGTFVTSFWLVAEVGTQRLISGMGSVLFLIAALVGLSERLRVLPAAATALAIVTALAGSSLTPDTGQRLSEAASRNWSPVYRLREEAGGARERYEGLTVKFQQDTRYHRLAVVEDEDTRYLRFDSSFQSGVLLADPFATAFRYTDFFHLGPAYKPDAKNLLFIGLGGGSSPKRLWRDFPTLKQEIVELDSVVVDVAREWFDLPDDDRVRTHVDDGRSWLVKDKRTWDLIAIDAFHSDGIPFHLSTVEFFDIVRERLAPGGVVVMNSIGALRGSDSRLFRSLVRTMRASFRSVEVHPVIEDPSETDESVRNLMIVAQNQATPSKEALLDRWSNIRAAHPSVPELVSAIEARDERTIPVADVPTLTDDFAPTDALLLN